MKNIKYLWCSPHEPTEQQREELKDDGTILVVKDLSAALGNIKKDTDLVALANLLVEYANNGYTIVQPGGSPAFQATLGRVFGENDLSKRLMYTFSERVSEDIPQPDGSVKKISIFKHGGWIKV